MEMKVSDYDFANANVSEVFGISDISTDTITQLFLSSPLHCWNFNRISNGI
jgi:hypothetical protein